MTRADWSRAVAQAAFNAGWADDPALWIDFNAHAAVARGAFAVEAGDDDGEIGGES